MGKKKYKTKSCKSKGKRNDVKYPSAGLLLELVRDEYSKERDRTRILDGKAAHFMTAIILVITVFIPITPFEEIKKVFLLSNDMWVVKCIMINMCILYVIGIAMLIYAFKRLLIAYNVTEFERFDVDNSAESYRQINKNAIESALCDNYINIVRENTQVNDNKVKNIKKGVLFCSIGVMIMALSTIIIKIIM